MKIRLIGIGFWGILVLMVGCATSFPTEYYIDEPTEETMIAQITSTYGFGSSYQKGVRVETLGNDTIVTWLETNRLFIFKGLKGFKGTIRFGGVNLVIGGVKVIIDERWIRVSGPDYNICQELYTEVDGKRTDCFGDRDLIINRDEIKAVDQRR